MDIPKEPEHYAHGGILQHVVHTLVASPQKGKPEKEKGSETSFLRKTVSDPLVLAVMRSVLAAAPTAESQSGQPER